MSDSMEMNIVRSVEYSTYHRISLDVKNPVWEAVDSLEFRDINIKVRLFPLG